MDCCTGSTEPTAKCVDTWPLRPQTRQKIIDDWARNINPTRQMRSGTRGFKTDNQTGTRDPQGLTRLEDPDRERLAAHVAQRRADMETADASTTRKLSAELNGIGAVLERWKPNRVQHVLVHTDTVAGRAATEIVDEALTRDGHQVQTLTAGGLRIDDVATFRAALSELTRELERWTVDHRAKRWQIVFNLTGGFKSVNAYLQALGMLYADRCVFLFEGVSAIMEIPALPVRLADADVVREHLLAFRRLAFGYSVKLDEVVGLSESLLDVDDEDVIASVWGDVVWARVRDTLLAECLLVPLSRKLNIGANVRRAFEKLESDRRVLVNGALDALSAHLDEVRSLPQSNKLKMLQGKPKPPSTHELYVWSDGAAWRLFGHFSKGEFVADSLGPHL